MLNRGAAAVVTATLLLILSLAAILALGSQAVAAQGFTLALSPTSGRPATTTQASGSIFSGCSPTTVTPTPSR